MNWIKDNSFWLLLIAIALLLLCLLYTYAEWKLRKAKKGLHFQELRREKLMSRIIEVNRALLKSGMSEQEIMHFWKESFEEAEIQHELPACTCKDVNQWDTWCRAKARFVMNPPDE